MNNLSEKQTGSTGNYSRSSENTGANRFQGLAIPDDEAKPKKEDYRSFERTPEPKRTPEFSGEAVEANQRPRQYTNSKKQDSPSTFIGSASANAAASASVTATPPPAESQDRDEEGKVVEELPAFSNSRKANLVKENFLPLEAEVVTQEKKKQEREREFKLTKDHKPRNVFCILCLILLCMNLCVLEIRTGKEGR